MPHADPSLSLARRVDAACDRFEAEWRAGRRPRIDDFARTAPEADREALRQALLAVELELKGGAQTDTSVSRESVRTGPARPEATTPALPDPSVPKRIGRFTVTGVLGAGAFGRVYRATDPQLGRDVAIKMPLPSALASDDDRVRFLKEARAAAGLHHPNICPVHEVGEEAGRPYIVMGFVPGQTLAAVLKARKEPLSPKQAALIARKLALALDAAHKKGVVHRDLKPANVMFDRERRDVVVTDFGLARAPRTGDVQTTRDGVLMGTPAYMSPEQARGDTRAVGPASDQYALGVMLYEMLTGRRPFTGTVTEVLGQILHVEPDPPTALRPDLDPALAAVCLTAMAKDPAARYGSMRQLADALAPFATDARPPGPAAPATASAETARETTETQRIADVFAFTEKAVEKAIRKHKTPTWMKVGLGLLGVLAVVVPSIVFFARTPTARVTIQIDVDVHDKSLAFFLDDKQIEGEALTHEIELKVGRHVLLVKQNGEVIRRYEFNVSKDAGPRIELKEDVPRDRPPPGKKSPPPPAADPDREAAEWVLGLGGVVRVADPDRVPTAMPDYFTTFPLIRPGDSLPRTPFKLTGVDLVDRLTGANEGGLAKLNGLKHLMYLDLMNTGVTDAGLARLTDLPDLRNLNLHATRVGDAGLKAVARFRSLEWLWLHYTPITDDGLAELTGLARLTALRVTGTKVTDRGLKHVAKLPRLEDLAVDQTQVSDAGMAELAGLTGLTTLAASGPEFTGAGLKDLHHLPKLATLLLDGPALTDDGLTALPGLTRLTWLELNLAHNVTDAGLKHVAGMTHLTLFRLTSNRVTDDGLANLSKLDQLWEVRLHGARIGDAGLTHLAPLWRLRALDLSGTAVTGTGLKHLAKLGQLNALLLQDCPVGDAGLAEAAGLKALEQLNLARTRVTDAGLPAVAKLAGLKAVDLTGSPVTNAGLAGLQKALPGCRITPEPK